MFLSEWHEFPLVPCFAGGDLMTAHVSMLLKSCGFPDMLPFSLCNKKRLAIRHMNRLLFPMTLSIPSYEIWKKVGLRTYQHLLIVWCLLLVQFASYQHTGDTYTGQVHHIQYKLTSLVIFCWHYTFYILIFYINSLQTVQIVFAAPKQQLPCFSNISQIVFYHTTFTWTL